MKKLIILMFSILVISSNVSAVFHKIGYEYIPPQGVDGKIVGDTLYLLDLLNFSILDISSPTQPVLISESGLGSSCQTLLIEGDIAYIGHSLSIEIIDISNPALPFLLASLPIDFYAVSLSLHDDILAAACDPGGLYFFDISDLHNPTLEAHYPEYWRAIEIEIVWPAAYVQNFEQQLNVFNIEDIYNIEIVAEIPNYGDKFLIENSRLYTNVENNWLNIFDISNPLAPVEILAFENVGIPLAVQEDRIFTAKKYIEVFQLNQDDTLSPLGFYDSWTIIRSFELYGDIAFVINGYAGLQILDLSDPIEDRLLGSIEILNNSGLPLNIPNMVVHENAVYLPLGSNELAKMIDISDLSNPTLSQLPNVQPGLVDLSLWNNILIAKDWGSFYSYDISNPLEPQLISSFEGISEGGELFIAEDCLIDYDINEISFFTITSATQIEEINSIEDIGIKTAFEAKDGYIYYAKQMDGISLVSLENPLLRNVFPLDDYVYALKADGDILYASTVHNVLLLDISDPMNISYITTIQNYEDSSFESAPIISGNELILADQAWNEILVYDNSDPHNPLLSQRYSGARSIMQMEQGDNSLLTLNQRSGFAVISIDDLLDSPETDIVSNPITLSNYPNPFNPSTKIHFTAKSGKDAKIEIFNVKGQMIRTLPVTLSPESSLGKGSDNTFSTTWDGTDQSGNPVSSGIYFINLKSDDRNLGQKKCLLLK